MELYKKYRPKTFKDIVGQEQTVSILTSMGKKGKIPHFIMFTGESGCGKTTLARILKDKLKCSDRDFKELNAADFRGIDMVRDIRRTINLSPLSGSVRIWLLDEGHQTSKDAQSALLKLLEDTPQHVYFFIATTHPEKLLPTVRSRATELKVNPLSDNEMEGLVKKVAEAEGITLNQDVVDKIVKHAGGSPRKGLVILDTVIEETDPEKQQELIQKNDFEAAAIDLARALIKAKPSWFDVKKILKNLKDDPEGVRRLVLSYCSTILLGDNKNIAGKAYNVMDAFRENFFNTGFPGLVLACFESIHGE